MQFFPRRTLSVGSFSQLPARVIALVLMALSAMPANALPDERRKTLDLQVRLAWAHASPGPVDGRDGKNTTLAIKAYRRMQGAEPAGDLTKEQRDALEEKFSDKPTLVEYEIAKEDVDGPFLDKIPGSMAEQAKLDRLAYTSTRELLAEKFQMYPDLLDELNPDADFTKAGTKITVPNLAADNSIGEKVERIDIDTKDSTLYAFGADDKILAAFPATVGSDETPSPKGTHEVKAVAPEPKYYYNPEKLGFKGVDAKEQLVIPPGPNNPVGLVWIDLGKEGYGIHGTPEPTDIRRQSSHGCVRLTNWDAKLLSGSVSPGVTVRFTPMDKS